MAEDAVGRVLNWYTEDPGVKSVKKNAVERVDLMKSDLSTILVKMRDLRRGNATH